MRMCVAWGLSLGLSAWVWGGTRFADDGNLVTEAGRDVLWQSGEHGLWRLAFRNGKTLSAADFATNGVPGGSFRRVSDTHLVWTSPAADVTVTAQAAEDGATDLVATVTPHAGETLMLDFPATLRFAPDAVAEFVYPGQGMAGPGVGFNADFFRPAPPDKPHAWKADLIGGKGYAHLYGVGLKMQPLGSAPVPITVTETGRAWFRKGVVRQLETWSRPVIRPPAPGQSDVVLVDSPMGPYLSGKHFGGTGMLWRFGVADSARHPPPAETKAMAELVLALATRNNAPERRKIALVALLGGPRAGAFTNVTLVDWRRALRAAVPPGYVYEEINTLDDLQRAWTQDEHLFIVNPYGEYFPTASSKTFFASLDALRAYVKAGGHWLEAGGYSFYQALTGGKYLSWTVSYPALFADFAHLRTVAGSTVALYGVQPRAPHAPWRNPDPFVPGKTGVGGDERGGWFFHAFACYAKPGASLTLPRVRLATGRPLDAALAAYGRDNTLCVPFAEKVKDPAVRAKLQRAPLFTVGGTAAEMKSLLDRVPAPTLLHLTRYLKGGFDKEYPDHLPPAPSFGTAAELADLFRHAHARGHLVSPYTNPTWWCDHPRGPSFLAAGEAPLSIGLDGKPYHERYAKNDGWTITFWHPAVQAANRETVRAFTEDYPVDLLFQDQCGARTWRWDFNPVAPSPTAYAEGMIAMNEEDSARVPLGTEDGWDQVVNRQAAVCGCSWRVVPTRGRPAWRDQLKEAMPPHTWRIQPVNLRLFHDKALFYMHDLGAFVTDEHVLAWMFALGYNLSLSGPATSFQPGSESARWYEWLAVLQSQVFSRIALKPLTAYEHDRAPLFARPGDPSREEDDGVVTAVWGDVAVNVNLGDEPRTVNGKRLAPYGWWVQGQDVTAGALAGRSPFVETPEGRWVYGEDPAFAAALPAGDHRDKAPAACADTPRRVGLVAFPGRVPSGWVKTTLADWRQALAASELATRYGVTCVDLVDAAALRRAIDPTGSDRCFAVINPYGEMLPVEDVTCWEETAARIREYVRHGGHWVEVGGASAYMAVQPGAPSRHVGGSGARAVGFSIQMDDLDERPMALRVATGAEGWFTPALAKRIAATSSQVNRSLLATPSAPVMPLVTDAAGRVWFGCHRFNGWGALWRLGGMLPDRALARDVVMAALTGAYTRVPPPPPPNPRRRVKKL